MPRAFTIAVCEHCGAEYRHRKPRQRFCSRECALTRCRSCTVKRGRNGNKYLDAEAVWHHGMQHLDHEGKWLCKTEYKRDREQSARLSKDHALRKLYGITIEQYEQMYNDQHGKCAICQTKYKSLHVDHCHSEGIVRGLLCNHCNIMLGHAREDPLTLARAIMYLTPEKGKLQAIKLVEELVGA